MIAVRKVSETATSITLGWNEVPGADGYRFYSAGILRSKTMDPSRTTVKFSKGQEPYKVEAVVLNHLDEGFYPPSNVVDAKSVWFPRTFNKEGASDARFCVSTTSPAYSHTEGTRIFDKGGGVYNSDGLCDGNRDPDFIAKKLDGTPLRGAKSMDNFGPCDLYDGLTEWPPDSYHK